jgi:isocitrate/isopropylmalate dehydrogenase
MTQFGGRALTAVEFDIIERREETRRIVEYAARIARDRDAARSVVQRAGIFTKAGRLTKHYRT